MLKNSLTVFNCSYVNVNFLIKMTWLLYLAYFHNKIIKKKCLVLVFFINYKKNK